MQVDHLPTIIKRITQAVKGDLKKKTTKHHIQRYLYTFAMQLGCDFPPDEIIASIFKLLQDENGEVSSDRYGQFIEVCLKIQAESEKTPIGGIFDRVIMGIKQLIYFDKVDQTYQPL